MLAAPPARSFVPEQFNPANWSEAQPLYQELLDRSINSPVELERWLADFSELASVIDEYGCRRYIDKSCHTDDEKIKQRFLQYIEQIEPRFKPLYFELQKRFLASPHRSALTDKKYAVLTKRWNADVEIFRDENVPLETQATKLVTDYDAINGAMTVNFRGRELTLQQVGKYLEEPDRPTRQEAWTLSAQRRYQDHEKVEEIFDRLLSLRATIARNASLRDYRDYMWRAYKRFDYTPEQCLAFADSIATACVPLVDKLDRQRRQDLGLPALRPWDTQVDPKNRPALAPFTEDQTPLFVDKTREIFGRVSPALAEDFESLRTRNNLDLQSRKGKQPGGYQCSLDEAREPFIFMNAAGIQRDVETLLHEGGHAFHCLAARDENLVFLRAAPIEFCEVASMSMELLGADHFDVFYDQADAARAKRTLLEGIIKGLTWVATIDSFQHWLYTNPGHSRDERTAEWLRLQDRFASKLDWSGYEHVRRTGWQRQIHLFQVPFYYVEYGIAQLGALQLWVKSRQDPHRAIANYRAALRLGGTRSLPELFAAAGLVFDFSPRTLEPLMNAVADELAALPR
ncbi:MAG TPA: M3 family oligoendopeptidase [Tepidisphaeraceae bacterium]|jgi:oligoendopeptidase F